MTVIIVKENVSNKTSYKAVIYFRFRSIGYLYAIIKKIQGYEVEIVDEL